MDTSSFFQYPDSEQTDESNSPVLMQDATSEEWDILLSFTTTQRFKAGDLVIVAGDKGDSLFLVAEGILDVMIPYGRNHTLSRLTSIQAGSVIGEQSFFDKQPRSVSCRAQTDGEMYRLSRDNFLVLSAKHPTLARNFLLDLGKIISLRLRDTTVFLSQGENR